MEENERIELVKETEILGKKIVIYRSIENPLFLAKDVADWIEHTQVSRMLKTVSVDEKVKVNNNHFENRTGGRGTWFVTENGLYEVCMQSRKPIAKDMKDKIKDFLHNIRTTGGAVELGKEAEFIEHYFPSFSEPVKLAMVQDLRNQNEELKERNEQLASDNKALTGEILSWSDRKRLNFGIRKLARSIGNKEGVVWNYLYKQVHYKYGINLKARNNAHKPYIDNVKESEWNMVIKSFAAICESYNQSPTDMLHQKGAIS